MNMRTHYFISNKMTSTMQCYDRKYGCVYPLKIIVLCCVLYLFACMYNASTDVRNG